MTEIKQEPIGPNTKLNIYDPEADHAAKTTPKPAPAAPEPEPEVQFSYCAQCNGGLFEPRIAIQRKVTKDGGIEFSPQNIFVCSRCGQIWDRS